MKTSYSDWQASHAAPPFRILNNVWNPDLPSGFGTQTLRVNTETRAILPSWAWDWPPRDSDVPASYPAIVYGLKPWDAPCASSCPSLPAPISELQELSVRWPHRVDATGRFNVAIELWFCLPGTAESATISHELMIWLAASGPIQPIGRPVLTTADYVLWHGDAPRWKTSSFVINASIPSRPLDLLGMITRLVKLKLLAATDQLCDIEFGTEIWDGNGVFECHLPQIKIRGGSPE